MIAMEFMIRCTVGSATLGQVVLGVKESKVSKLFGLSHERQSRKRCSFMTSVPIPASKSPPGLASVMDCNVETQAEELFLPAKLVWSVFLS